MQCFFIVFLLAAWLALTFIQHQKRWSPCSRHSFLDSSNMDSFHCLGMLIWLLLEGSSIAPTKHDCSLPKLLVTLHFFNGPTFAAIISSWFSIFCGCQASQAFFLSPDCGKSSVNGDIYRQAVGCFPWFFPEPRILIFERFRTDNTIFYSPEKLFATEVSIFLLFPNQSQ